MSVSHKQRFIVCTVATKSKPQKKDTTGARWDIPEENEVCVDVDGALQGGEHVGDEESLRGAHPEHVLHVLPLLMS